jgi:glycosyltransferase involved in cell wall biosynthesis
MGEAESAKAPLARRRGAKRDRPPDFQLVDPDPGEHRGEVESLKPLRQKVADLSRLLALRDQRILDLTRREAALAARVEGVNRARIRRRQLRRERFLNSPAGWACRIFFRIPLTAIRIADALFGATFPRVRAAAGPLERMLVRRHWRAFMRNMRTRIRKRVRAVATRYWSAPLAAWRDRRTLPMTVVVFANGSEDGLQGTIGCIRAQTLSRLEILVIRHKPGAGQTPSGRRRPDYIELVMDGALPGEAVRRAIGKARGKYVCCLDAGDRIAPTYLEKCLFVLEDDAACGMAYSRASHDGGADEQALGDFDSREPLTPVWMAPHAVFRRRDALSLSREKCPADDPVRAFWSSLARACKRGRAIPERLVTLVPARAQMIGVAWPPPDSRPVPLERSRRRPLRAPRGRKFVLLGRPSAADSRPHMLVVVPWLSQGGAEMLLLDVLHGVAHNWRLSIVTTMNDANAAAPEFAALGAEIFQLPALVGPGSLADAIIALARSRRTRLILSSGATAYYSALAEIKSELPSLTAVDILHNDTSHIADAVKASRSIDRHVAVTYRVAASLAERGVPEGRVVVIPNGVDVNGAFSFDRLALAEARRKLEIGPGTFVITFVGRLADEKRPDAFLEIVAGLERAAGVEAIVVGDGPLADEVDLAIRQQQLPVRRIARVERALMHEVYAASDLLVVPSVVEGMPLVVLEALAMGCPVAATAAGDLGRIIVNGYNGYLVPIGDVRALIPLIRTHIRDPKRHAAMSAAAHRSVRAAGATLETMAARYERLLDDLSGRRTGCKARAAHTNNSRS